MDDVAGFVAQAVQGWRFNGNLNEAQLTGVERQEPAVHFACPTAGSCSAEITFSTPCASLKYIETRQACPCWHKT